ncbi:MAG: TolC family protein [Candidatus Latescibacteria bacterium]|nr:TolC family protein [Candidatus Latescibacterota bacterium]
MSEVAAGAASDALVVLALARSPRLAALAEGIAAAREAAPAEGALPDPMLGFSARGEDYPGADIGEDPMAMAAIEVSQTLPWPGKRGRRQSAAEARIGIAEAELVAMRRRLASEVRAAYAEQTAIDASRRALRASIDLLDLLAPSLAVRYETGQSGQRDLIELQLERLRLAAELDDLEARGAGHLAELAAMLDVAVADLPPLDAGLPAIDDTVVADIAPADLAAAAVAEARVAGARRRAEAAQGEGSPDIVLGAEYGWRDALPPMVTARVGVELPLWQSRKQDALARAAGHEHALAEAERREALAMAGAEVAGLQARLDAAQRQIVRLNTGSLPQAALAAESARAGYATGDAGVAELVGALRRLAETRAMLAEREADRYTAWAALRALAGRDPVLQENRP